MQGDKTKIWATRRVPAQTVRRHHAGMLARYNLR